MKRPAHLEPMTPEQFHAHLEALGWRQADFAERTGMTRATINKWATGRAPVAPWAGAYLGALCDMAAMRDKYLTPLRLLRREATEPEPDQIEHEDLFSDDATGEPGTE